MTAGGVTHFTYFFCVKPFFCNNELFSSQQHPVAKISWCLYTLGELENLGFLNTHRNHMLGYPGFHRFKALGWVQLELTDALMLIKFYFSFVLSFYLCIFKCS